MRSQPFSGPLPFVKSRTASVSLTCRRTVEVNRRAVPGVSQQGRRPERLAEGSRRSGHPAGPGSPGRVNPRDEARYLASVPPWPLWRSGSTRGEAYDIAAELPAEFRPWLLHTRPHAERFSGQGADPAYRKAHLEEELTSWKASSRYEPRRLGLAGRRSGLGSEQLVTGVDASLKHQLVSVPMGGVWLESDLVIPSGAQGIVAFAHGSGSGRHSPRNQFVAKVLQRAGLATILLDLLTVDEE